MPSDELPPPASARDDSAAYSVGEADRVVANERTSKVSREVKADFLDDLQAANLMKTYLVSNGVEVPGDVLEGLAGLTARYSADGPEPSA